MTTTDPTLRSGVTVREADPSEYPAIADLLVEAYTSRFWVTDWYRGNLQRVAEHALTSHWWVAVDADGAIRGAVRTPRDERPGATPESREATFGLLGTDPAVAGQGVATALVDAVVERARAAGFDAVAIRSGPQMTGAHQLYRRLGFVRCEERETLVVDGGQRLLSFVLPLRPGVTFRPPVASPVDFEAYGTIYHPRNVPPASVARGADGYPFHGRIGSADLPAEPGRYHLYVSWACPFAHRVAIVRVLKGLENAVPLWVVDPIRDGRGWAFRDGRAQTRDGGGGGFALLREAYDSTVGGCYQGRISVPVLWDSVRQRIVSNAYDEIALDLAQRFDASAEHPELDLYPSDLRDQIDRVDARVHADLVTAVYDAGFARTQEVYDRAVARVFDTLTWLEDRLSDGRPHLFGDRLTEADVRVWPTLARFDLVYHGHFKVNLRRLADHPALQAYAERLAALPAFASTTDVDHIRRHYYGTQRHVNPTGIVPVGPALRWLPEPS